MRPDFEIIEQWIQPGYHLLDLGCGNGELLSWLQEKKQVTGYGLEIDLDNIRQCIEKGVNVICKNLDTDLHHIKSHSFDTVVMTQALQAMNRPDHILEEMLRIGREAIVTFPNFGYWRTRTYLLRRGRMPVSETLPYNWYDTPNIHLCTFKDFEALCHEKQLKILDRTVTDSRHQSSPLIKRFPNLLGEIAIYHLTR